MAEFDPELWRRRAWERFSRALRAGKPKEDLERTWAGDVLAIGDMSRLVSWCGERKIKVDFAKKVGATYYPHDKEVKVSSRLAPPRQVVYLLHECGHHLIGLKELNERYQLGYTTEDPSVKRTFPHRLAVLEEEFEAWHRGWKLVQRLGLNVDRSLFDEVRQECLKSYIKWSLRPGKGAEEE